MSKKKKPKQTPPPAKPQQPEGLGRTTAPYIVSKGRLPPNWRWLTIIGQIACPSPGQLNRSLYKAAETFQPHIDDPNHSELSRRYPYLYEAWSIYDDSREARWIIEARLVAGEPVQQIADRLQYEVETIVNYEFLFFDVAAHIRPIKNFDYFQTHCLPGVAAGSLSKENLDTLLKALALYGGSQILDDYLTQGLSTDAAIDYYRKAAKSALAKSGMVAEMGRTVNRYTERFVGEHMIEMSRVEIMEKQLGSVDPDGTNGQLGTAQLAGLAMTVAQFSPDLVNRTPADEPRAAALLIDALNDGTMNTDETPSDDPVESQPTEQPPGDSQ